MPGRITDRAFFRVSDLNRDRKLTSEDFIGSRRFETENLALAVYSAFEPTLIVELNLGEYLRVLGK